MNFHMCSFKIKTGSLPPQVQGVDAGRDAARWRQRELRPAAAPVRQQRSRVAAGQDQGEQKNVPFRDKRLPQPRKMWTSFASFSSLHNWTRSRKSETNKHPVQNLVFIFRTEVIYVSKGSFWSIWKCVDNMIFCQNVPSDLTFCSVLSIIAFFPVKPWAPERPAVPSASGWFMFSSLTRIWLDVDLFCRGGGNPFWLHSAPLKA